MSNLSDHDLLQRFSRQGDEAAFRILVERYGAVVHGVALRRLQSAEAARDVTQEVFVTLAKKAGSLSAKITLGGWLHKVSYAKSIDAIRSESRRKKREESYAMDLDLTKGKEEGNHWGELSPVLDTALGELSSSDRSAIVLRYFQNQPNRKVASLLGISEAAAKKRVSRAVDKLRSRLFKKGCVLSASGLGALSANAAVPLPAATISSVCKTATLAANSSAAVISASLPSTLVTLKAKASAVAAVICLGAAGVVTTKSLSKPDNLAEERRPLSAKNPHAHANAATGHNSRQRGYKQSMTAFSQQSRQSKDDASFIKAREEAESQLAIMLWLDTNLEKHTQAPFLRGAHGMDKTVAAIAEKHLKDHHGLILKSLDQQRSFVRVNRDKVLDLLALKELARQKLITPTQEGYYTRLQEEGIEAEMELEQSEPLEQRWYRHPHTMAKIHAELPRKGAEQFNAYVDHLKTLDRESEAFLRSQELARMLNLSGKQRQQVFERFFELENGQPNLSDLLNPEQQRAHEAWQTEETPNSN